MPLVDLYASLPHYRHHLEPVWQALPAEVRGRVWDPRTWRAWEVPHDRVVMVAGMADHHHVAPRATVLVEHGAGQTYDGDARSAGHGSYAGGDGLERVVLFVCPSERVAARWRAKYSAEVVVAGSPRLDQLTRVTRVADARNARAVALTFHWNCSLVPETRSALPHYHRALAGIVAELRAHEVGLIGHAHPRMAATLEPIWRRNRVRWVPDFEDVVAGADLLVGDNTSALYEWAALDRPVVVLNAPWYRRHVSHGLRFWDLVPGVQVDEPEGVVPAVLGELADPPRSAALRAAATAGVYARADGQAAARAAAAIVEALPCRTRSSRSVE